MGGGGREGLLFLLASTGGRQQHSTPAKLGHFLQIQNEVVIPQLKAGVTRKARSASSPSSGSWKMQRAGVVSKRILCWCFVGFN